MRLDDAIKQSASLVPKLKGKDALAVHVLVELAKRVRRVQKPLRQVANAISPDLPPLTQNPMFKEDS